MEQPSISTPDTPSGVLAALAERQSVVDRAEVHKLVLAVEWATLHPASSVDTAATVPGSEGQLAIAGEGAPMVAEFCVADLALALGVSTDAGRRFLGDAVEIRHRLPRLWAEVTACRVAVWKARRIAQATVSLVPEAAAYVDRHLAPVAARCSFAQVERAVDDALRRYDPIEAEHRRLLAADARHFDVDTHQVSFDGLVHVDAELDLRDALDLDDAIAAGAQVLADLGCAESLDVRRSLAAGALARGEQTLELPAREPSRDVTIYVHLDGSDVAGVENTRGSTTIGQVRDWCTRSGTTVLVRPVLDLAADLRTEAYEPTPLQREQARLTNPTCVFPHCTRPSRRHDLDHIQEFDDGGPTSSGNLAPLCRGHHRLKTHGGWSYVRTGPTSFTWTSPLGHTYAWDTSHARHPR